MKLLYSAVLVLGLCALPARGLDATTSVVSAPSLSPQEIKGMYFSDPSLQPDDNETYNAVDKKMQAWVNQKATPMALSDLKDQVQKDLNTNTPQAVAQKTTAVTAPVSFADRVSKSVADFLPLFGLSMDAISTSDDKKSVTLKLNPLRSEYGAISLTATAAEPVVFTSLSEGIVEAARDKQVKALQAKAGDFGDVTTTLTYGYTRPGVSWTATRHMFGRDFKLYKYLVQGLLTSSWGDLEANLPELRSSEDNLRRRFQKPLARAVPDHIDFGTLTFKQIREAIGDGRLPFSEAQLLEAMLDKNLVFSAITQRVNSWNLDALPYLIDNQPQLTFTIAYRSSDQFVGPDATSANLHYEMGTRNFNTMLRQYGTLVARAREEHRGGLTAEDEARIAEDSRFKAFQNVVSGDAYRGEDKFIFDASYKRSDPYELTYSYTQSASDAAGNPLPDIPHTLTLNLDRVTEWRGSLSYTRFILYGQDWTKNKTGVDLPRLTLSVEGLRVQGDPLRKNNRIVAKASYLMPATNSISMPVTLTWANRSEFLGEQDHNFSAHLGISYKMNNASQ